MLPFNSDRKCLLHNPDRGIFSQKMGPVVPAEAFADWSCRRFRMAGLLAESTWSLQNRKTHIVGRRSLQDKTHIVEYYLRSTLLKLTLPVWASHLDSPGQFAARNWWLVREYQGGTCAG